MRRHPGKGEGLRAPPLRQSGTSHTGKGEGLKGLEAGKGEGLRAPLLRQPLNRVSPSPSPERDVPHRQG